MTPTDGAAAEALLAPPTALADEVVARWQAAFEPAADPERAGPMTAYMKGHFPFLGITTPQRRALARSAVAGLPAPEEADVMAVAAAAWALDPREYQYAAVDYAVRWVRRCSPDFLPVAERLVSTKSWWDTVDLLAANVVGPLVAATPALRADMDRWLVSDDLWLARSAILHQLRWKADTDDDWLFAACLARAADTDFFLRKAIGWALREYTKTDAAAVRRFVADHDAELSGLSKREALKWLDRRAARGDAAVDDEVEASASGIRKLSPPPSAAVSA
ncbi:MAG: DNA alkylation repair protein [Acidimicrobiales bacterium]|nr:DNA alkylation repair protein [Acidimicrobiales bacterium]